MSPHPMSDDAAETVDDDAPVETAPTQAMLYDVPLTEAFGQVVLHPSVDTYFATIEAIKADGYVSVVDLCGADYLTHGGRSLPAGVAPERFEIIVAMIAHTPPRRLRIRVQISETDPTLPTLFDLFPGTEAMEREAFDMFGIVFTDHPDPTRILMPPDWDGHPLRKDFGIGSVPVQFKGAPAPR